MSQNIRILFLEDNPEDFELILYEVKNEYPDLIYKCVSDKQQFLEELKSFKPDLVLSDYSLPTINGMEVISIVKDNYDRLPLIIVTGAISEETAVKCIKTGADDYILKDNLIRLNPAIKSSFEKIALQSEKENIIKNLEENERYYRTILNQLHEDILVINRDYIITDINNSMLFSTGQLKENIIGKNCFSVSHNYVTPCDQHGEECPLNEVFRTGKVVKTIHKHVCENGEYKWIDLLFSPYLNADGIVTKVIESARDITRFYEMQQKIKESEKKYRNLVENAGVGIIVDDELGNIKYFNDVVCEIFGYSKNEMQKLKNFELMHQEDKKRVKTFHDKRIKGEKIESSYEFCGIRKDRSKIYLHVDATPVKENNKIIGTRSYFHDITEKTLAAQSLQESEEKYRLLVENAHDGIEITQNDIIIFSNARFAEMLGYTVNEITKLRFSDIFTEKAKTELKKRQEKRYSSEHVPNYYEASFIKKDGGIIDVEVKYEIINFKSKPATFAIIRDITESKKIELEIRKLSAGIEQSPLSIVITDIKGNIEYVNPKFCEVSGYSKEETIGKNPRILNSGELPKEYFKELWETILKGESWKGEFRNCKKNGELFSEDATIGPIFDEYGRITHFIALKEDITKHKELENQLRQSQKLEAIGQLAGGVAHDFNNLLTIINGYSSLLMEKFTENKSIRKDVSQIQIAGKKAGELTQQLLAFSRKQIISPTIINLNNVIIETEKMLKRLIGENIEIILNLDNNIGKIKADQGQLNQIIMNLTVNARDAMPNGGKIIVETSMLKIDNKYSGQHFNTKPGNYILMAITDTGTGMDDDTKMKIFDPFFTTKIQGKGTGLGLSTVYGIVKQSEGYIWVYSELGRGTTFKIYFPESIEYEDEINYRLKDEEPANGGNETIMIVEDDEAVRDVTKDILTMHGYKVFVANNGSEALKQLNKNKEKVDLVITDVIMPKMGGPELANKIQSKTPEMKIIYFSGYTDDNFLGKGILETGLPFLQKPFTKIDLLKTIRNELDK